MVAPAFSQRVQDLLTAHVQTDAQGHVVFDGKQAQTLSEDLGYGGNDTTGPWVQAQLVPNAIGPGV